MAHGKGQRMAGLEKADTHAGRLRKTKQFIARNGMQKPVAAASRHFRAQLGQKGSQWLEARGCRLIMKQTKFLAGYQQLRTDAKPESHDCYQLISCHYC